MSFLAPWFLALGAAALVPLLIHLLRRRIGVQVEFPAARYLARAEREHSRTLRLRNLLLMLLRVLAVLLIAAAAARPTARLAGAGSGHAPTALAIVVDNSMSASVVQDGAPLLDRFKRMAREAIAAASAEDRLWLVTADASLRGGTPQTLLEEIDRIRPYAGAGQLRDAVTSAAAAVQSSAMSSRQVAILTDGQRTAWPEPVQLAAQLPVLIWAPEGQPPANRAVIHAEPRPDRWTPRGALATRALSADSTTYRMALGERTLARGTIGPNEEALVRAAPAERGWTSGTIEIEPDELPADNVRHFALWIGPPPAVRVSPGARAFARNAVDVLRASERVVEGSGIQIAAADEATAIPALLLPPTDRVRIGAANRTLERLGIPWRFGAMSREESVARGQQVPGVTVTLRYHLLPRGVPDAETLAVVGREPWIVSGPKYVLVGSPLVPEASALPVSASFLPWLADALSSRLHTDPGSVRYAAPGEQIARPAGVSVLESAAGGRISLSGDRFAAPASAGTFFFIQGSRRVGALVVNPEVDESRLERWPPDELRQRIVSSGGGSAAGVRVARDASEWVSLAFSGSASRSLVAPLLVALLLILGVESVAATPGRRGR